MKSEELTIDNYYDFKCMSSTAFKAFMECEHKGLAMYNGDYKITVTKPMLTGSYVDAWCEGTLDKFKMEHPDIFKRDGTLKSDFVKADEIIERIKREPVFMDSLNGEKQVIVTGKIEGIPFKGKIDVLKKNRIIDLKVMRSCERVMGKSLVEHWGYDIQGAIYQELEYQMNGVRKPFDLAIATKETPTGLELVNVEQHNLDNALDHVKRNLARIKKIISGEIKPLKCNRCEYCRETKVVTEPISSEFLGLSDYDIKVIKGEEL